jgi:hypothetical protein
MSYIIEAIVDELKNIDLILIKDIWNFSKRDILILGIDKNNSELRICTYDSLIIDFFCEYYEFPLNFNFINVFQIILSIFYNNDESTKNYKQKDKIINVYYAHFAISVILLDYIDGNEHIHNSIYSIYSSQININKITGDLEKNNKFSILYEL